MSAAVCLFIGGPWDGRRAAVADALESITAPIVGAASGPVAGVERSRLIKEVVYRRARLFAPGRNWSVFVPAIAPDGDVIERLIAGYGVAIAPRDGDGWAAVAQQYCIAQKTGVN